MSKTPAAQPAVTNKPVKVISITAGKGGVGKTNIAVNLAIALAKLNNKVMLLDADFGLANVDVLLGLPVRKSIFHVLKGECQLDDIQIEGPCGIKIIPAGSGLNKKFELNTLAYANLVRSFSFLTQDIDILIIDTAAGISQQVLHFLYASQEIVVVVCNEPTSISDSYALIKLLHTHYNVSRCKVLVNMVNMVNEGREVFMNLHDIAARFLNINLQYIGEIPQDIYLRLAIKNRQAVLTEFPGAKSSQAIMQLAKRVKQWPMPTALDGRVAFFFDRFVRSEQIAREDVE